jgi:glycosyltransferase involved in cell wall biosynthesis
MQHAPHLLLFDLYHRGHHGQHIRVLMEHWLRHDLPGRLDIVVSHEFGERFPELLDAARNARGIAFHPTGEPVRLHDKTGRLAVLKNDRRIGRLLRRAVVQHRPDHCMMMYFDHVQFSLATDMRFDFPVRLSGTYFRPSFYYRRAKAAPFAPRAVVDDLQKRALLRLALRNPHVDTLFCLDPYAVAPIESLGTSASVVHLPEPFEVDPPQTEAPDDTRRRLQVEEGRQVLLLFGSLDPRKGVLELLEAFRALPDDLARRACLVMAGETTAIHHEMTEAMAALRRRDALQVVHLDTFVSDEEMHSLFRAAALVLVPYQRHVGSSGVVVRAAAAGVPVLGPDYGMLGTLIRDRRLGLSVDTTQPAEIARGLARFLDPDAAYPFEVGAAQAFAAANTEEAMAETIFGHVL